MNNKLHFIRISVAVVAVAISLRALGQTSDQKSSPSDLVDALHSAFGKHDARAVHAKGIILEGTFTPSPEAKTITKAAHLQKSTIRVTIRFSDFTGIPDISDTNGGANPRGFAIKFYMPGDRTTDIVGHSFNGFPTKNSDDFRVLLLAIGSNATDTKPTDLDRFLESHPIAKTFLTTQKPAPVSYGTAAYFGVNAFKFTNEKGESHFIRYRFIPVEGEQYLTPEQISKSGPNYLEQEIPIRVAKKSIKYTMYAQIAEPGDVIDDPSIAWPDSRRLVKLGVIVIEKMGDNTTSGDKKLSFMPNNVPAGIEPADPMIDFRSKAYPISVRDRNK